MFRMSEEELGEGEKEKGESLSTFSFFLFPAALDL